MEAKLPRNRVLSRNGGHGHGYAVGESTEGRKSDEHDKASGPSY